MSNKIPTNSPQRCYIPGYEPKEAAKPTPHEASPTTEKAEVPASSSTKAPSPKTIIPKEPSPQKAESSKLQQKRGTASQLRPKAQGNKKTTTLEKAGDITDVGHKSTIELFKQLVDLTKGMAENTPHSKEYAKQLGALSDKMDRIASGAKIAPLLMQAAASLQKGEKRVAFAKLLGAVAEVYNTLPESSQRKITKTVSDFMRKVGNTKLLRSFKHIAHLLPALNRAKVVPHMMKAVAAMIEGNPTEFAKETKDIGKKLFQADKKTLMHFSFALAMMLPPEKYAKFIAKSGARKLPVLGTAVMALSDTGSTLHGLYQAARGQGWRGFWRGLAGLGSTACGLIPGVGTAGSAIVDTGLLIEDIQYNFHALSKKLKQ